MFFRRYSGNGLISFNYGLTCVRLAGSGRKLGWFIKEVRVSFFKRIAEINRMAPDRTVPCKKIIGGSGIVLVFEVFTRLIFFG